MGYDQNRPAGSLPFRHSKIGDDGYFLDFAGKQRFIELQKSVTSWRQAPLPPFWIERFRRA